MDGCRVRSPPDDSFSSCALFLMHRMVLLFSEHKWLKQQKKSLPLLNELVALKASSSSTTAAALETERFLLSSLDRAIQQCMVVVEVEAVLR